MRRDGEVEEAELAEAMVGVDLPGTLPLVFGVFFYYIIGMVMGMRW